jgi:dephospho-CoA kinase
MTFILGLTGSIGTGKSTVSRILGRLKFPIYDADKEVYGIYAHDSSFKEEFSKVYPHYMKGAEIDRQRVAQEAFDHPQVITWLEAHLHPRVRGKALSFIKTHQEKKTPLIILDIPLLFEKGYDVFCHGVLVTLCQPTLQQQRVLERPGMTLEKFRRILSKQSSQEEKKEKATWVIDTDQSKLHLFKRIRTLMTKTCIQEEILWELKNKKIPFF